jgi:hypothetical protein
MRHRVDWVRVLLVAAALAAPVAVFSVKAGTAIAVGDETSIPKSGVGSACIASVDGWDATGTLAAASSQTVRFKCYSSSENTFDPLTSFTGSQVWKIGVTSSVSTYVCGSWVYSCAGATVAVNTPTYKEWSFVAYRASPHTLSGADDTMTMTGIAKADVADSGAIVGGQALGQFQVGNTWTGCNSGWVAADSFESSYPECHSSAAGPYEGPEDPACWSPPGELWAPSDPRPSAGSGGISEVIQPGQSVDVRAPWGAEVGQVYARWRGSSTWQPLTASVVDPDEQVGSLQVSPFAPAALSVTAVEFKCDAVYFEEEAPTPLYSYWHLNQGVPILGWTPFHATNLKRACMGVEVTVLDMDEEELNGTSVLADGDTVTIQVVFTYSTNNTRLSYKWAPLAYGVVDVESGGTTEAPATYSGIMSTIAFTAGTPYTYTIGPFDHAMPIDGLVVSCKDSIGLLDVFDTSAPPYDGEISVGGTPPAFGSHERGGCFASSNWDLFSPSTWISGGLKMGGCYLADLFVPSGDGLESFRESLDEETALGHWYEPVGVVPEAFGLLSQSGEGCSIGMTIPTGQPTPVSVEFDTCSGDSSTVRTVVYTASTVGILTLGLFGVSRLAERVILLGARGEGRGT